MKVIESDTTDRYGKYPIIFPKSATAAQIYDWLYDHYGGEGYKFAIVIDVSHDMREDPGPTYVYFLDEIEDELKAYSGR